MGERTQKGILPSINEELKKVREKSVKTRGYEHIDPYTQRKTAIVVMFSTREVTSKITFESIVRLR
jgi:hypothetical protein